MRAGTQTLIQALQALPWTGSNGSDNEEDGPDSGTGESDSEEERPKCRRNLNMIEVSLTCFYFSETVGFFYTHHSPSLGAVATCINS